MFSDAFSDSFQSSEENVISYDISQCTPRSEIDVILLYADKTDKELIPGVPASFSASGDLDLAALIDTLKNDDHPLEGSMVFYYSRTADLYIYCGKDPLPISAIVPSYDIARDEGRQSVTLRVRIIEKVKVEEESNLGCKFEFDELSQESETEDSVSAKPGRRTRHKERKIGEAIELVLKWRKLYNGVIDPNTGKLYKYSLEEAAKKVGVAKKSLDDYLLMIKHAKNYGFNFQEHHNERFGVIRAFVKKGKHASNKSDTNSTISDSVDDERETETPKCRNSKKIRKEFLAV